MNSSSEFDSSVLPFSELSSIPTNGSTCDAFCVRLHGKLHFLKRLKSEYATNPHYVEALRKEFETVYQLEHTSLPRYISLGNDYILMEYIDGVTLTEFLKENPLYFSSTSKDGHQHLLDFSLQLLQALEYLHSHQILHLDLKPNNILITRIHHDVKLVDFGFCYTDSRPFTTGHTDAFAAPEQLSADFVSFTPSTDLYAFGRILQTIGEVSPLPIIYNKVSLQCTEPLPVNRYQSATEVIQAINNENNKRGFHLTKTKTAIQMAKAFVIVIVFVIFFVLLSRLFHPVEVEKESIDATPIKEQPLSKPEEKEIAISKTESLKNTIQTPASPISFDAYYEKLESSTLDNTSSSSSNDDTSRHASLVRSVPQAYSDLYHSTIGTFRDSVFSPSVQEQWIKAQNQFLQESPAIEEKLQHDFSDIPPEDVTEAINDYIKGELESIVKQMILNRVK